MNPDVLSSELLTFLAILPVCLFIAYSDLKYMKIPNVAVLATLVIFAIVGFITLPTDAYLWRFVHFGVVLVIGFVLSAIGVLGAGDAKFAAAAAPFVAPSDIGVVLIILALMGPVAIVLHRFGGRVGLNYMFPTWESWQRKRDFPFGFPLTVTLMFYLGILAFS